MTICALTRRLKPALYENGPALCDNL